MWKTVLTRLVSALPVLIALAGYPASVWVGYNTGYENSQVKKNAEIAQMKLIDAEAKNSANKIPRKRYKMQLFKIKTALAAAVSTASVLTACGSTTTPLTTPLTTPVQVVEKAVMPPIPGELLVKPLRPAELKQGTAQAILEHAVELGVYIGELENQNNAWRLWATGGEP